MEYYDNFGPIMTSVMLAPHFSKNEILVKIPNAPRRVLEFLPKIKNSFGINIKKKIKKLGVLTSQNEERKIAISSKPLNLAP